MSGRFCWLLGTKIGIEKMLYLLVHPSFLSKYCLDYTCLTMKFWNCHHSIVYLKIYFQHATKLWARISVYEVFHQFGINLNCFVGFWCCYVQSAICCHLEYLFYHHYFYLHHCSYQETFSYFSTIKIGQILWNCFQAFQNFEKGFQHSY